MGCAALGSLLASYISCAGLLVYIYRRDLVIRLRGIEWRYLRSERELLRFIVPKGLMMGLQSLIMTLSALALVGMEIGRASCRERVCQYVYISVVAVALKKKKIKITYITPQN